VDDLVGADPLSWSHDIRLMKAHADEGMSRIALTTNPLLRPLNVDVTSR
jgi:hypothetical protein